MSSVLASLRVLSRFVSSRRRSSSFLEEFLVAAPESPPATRRCAGVGLCLPSCLTVAALASLTIVVAMDRSSLFHRDGVAPDSPVGWVAIVAACLMMGSFGILVKAPAVIALGLGPSLFQAYVNLGASITIFSLAAILLGGKVFTAASPWGILGGFIYVAANLGSTVGIRTLGYGVATAIWGGTTIVVSFLWGACIFRQTLGSVAGSTAGLFTLILGVLAAFFASSGVQRNSSRKSSSCSSSSSSDNSPSSSVTAFSPRSHEELGEAGSVYAKREQAHEATGWAASQSPDNSRAKGIAAMMAGAALNGSLNVPYLYYAQTLESGDKYTAELTYLVGFVIGIVLGTTVLVVPMWLKRKPMYVRTLMGPGFLTGLYWASGYVSALYATKYLGITVGYPLCQCAIVVSGVWGILYYREITSCVAIAMFAFSMALIIAGAAMLAEWAVV